MKKVTYTTAVFTWIFMLRDTIYSIYTTDLLGQIITGAPVFTHGTASFESQLWGCKDPPSLRVTFKLEILTSEYKWKVTMQINESGLTC